jgi:hypothetical protein
VASSSYERRNARARSLGYESYYDYRVHGSGTVPASQPVTPEMREANRGHRSAADLGRLIDRYAGRDIHVIPAGLDRDARGRWKHVDVLVIMPDGSERRFILRGRQASTAELERLRASLTAAGVPFLAAPSIDVFADADEPDVELEDAG